LVPQAGEERIAANHSQCMTMPSATIISALGWVAFAIGVLAWVFPQASQTTAMTVVTFGCFSAWASCSAISGILSGTIHDKYFSYNRAEKPGSFWWTVFFYASLGIAMAFLAIREYIGFN
jgi:hypothetical protein